MKVRLVARQTLRQLKLGVRISRTSEATAEADDGWFADARQLSGGAHQEAAVNATLDDLIPFGEPRAERNHPRNGDRGVVASRPVQKSRISHI